MSSRQRSTSLVQQPLGVGIDPVVVGTYFGGIAPALATSMSLLVGVLRWQCTFPPFRNATLNRALFSCPGLFTV
jgi:hypothetical protein